MKKVGVLYNPHSGRGDSKKKIDEAFRGKGVEARFVELRQGFEQLLDNLAAEGFKIFAAAGGDGTVNALASWIIDKKLRMGVIPIGTLNHFAKDMKLPLEIDKAVSVIAKDTVKPVDVGTVNGQVFLNNSSIGIYARIAHTKTATRSWTLRLLLGLASGSWFILKPPKYNVNLRTEAKTITRTTPIVFIGNNKYDLTDLGLFNRRSLSAGRLGVYIIKTHNPLRLILVALGILLGRVNSVYFEEFTAKEITIISKRKRLLVARDGEVQKMATPLTYEIKSGQLNVLTPPA